MMDLSRFGFSTVEGASEIKELAVEFEDLRSCDEERIARYAMYRAENEVARKIDLDADIGEVDYGKRRRSDVKRRHRIPLPFGNALNVKHTYRIAGRLPDIVVDRRDETPFERYRSNTMEKIAWGIIRGSGDDVIFKDGAWDGSEVGATCFEVYFDIETQLPIIRPIDPAGVVVVKGLENPHDFQRVYRFWTVPLATLKAEYRDSTFRGEPVRIDKIEADKGVTGQKFVTICQMADKQRVIRFALESRVPLYEYDHKLDFVPYVVIPNIGPERDIFGWADYEFYRALTRYLAVLLGRGADVLAAVSAGAYKNKKSGNSNAAITKALASGGVIDVGREGDVEPVDVPEMPAFAAQHQDLVMELIKWLGFAPDAAWGEGSAGSGSDRNLQLQPMLELTAMKQTNWSAGLARLFAMAYKMMERKMADRAYVRGSVQNGHKRQPFNFPFGPGVDPVSVPNPAFNTETDEGIAEEEYFEFPRTPEELFQKDYSVRFHWANRIDPDDPGYVMSELAVFAHGGQSLETLLERLGRENPEDEMRRIENESKRFPWVNDGRVRLIIAQMAQMQAASSGAGQGAGGGAPPDAAGGLAAALGMMGTKDGRAMDQDAGTRALPSATGEYTGGA
jgi:hypothetical protein